MCAMCAMCVLFFPRSSRAVNLLRHVPPFCVCVIGLQHEGIGSGQGMSASKGPNAKRRRKRVRWVDQKDDEADTGDFDREPRKLEEVQLIGRGFEIGAVSAQRQQRARRSAREAEQTRKSSFFLQKVKDDQKQFREALERSRPTNNSESAGLGLGLVPRSLQQPQVGTDHCFNTAKPADDRDDHRHPE